MEEEAIVVSERSIKNSSRIRSDPQGTWYRPPIAAHCDINHTGHRNELPTSFDLEILFQVDLEEHGSSSNLQNKLIVDSQIVENKERE